MPAPRYPPHRQGVHRYGVTGKGGPYRLSQAPFRMVVLDRDHHFYRCQRLLQPRCVNRLDAVKVDHLYGGPFFFQLLVCIQGLEEVMPAATTAIRSPALLLSTLFPPISNVSDGS